MQVVFVENLILHTLQKFIIDKFSPNPYLCMSNRINWYIMLDTKHNAQVNAVPLFFTLLARLRH